MEEQRSDVLVIGAGAVGLSAAYYLREAGLTVTVVERDSPGSGSSLKNCGLVCPSHFVPLAAPGMMAAGLKWMLDPVSPFYVKPRLDPGLISWVLKFQRACRPEHANRSKPLLFELNDASVRLYRDLAARKVFGFDYAERGLLLVYNSDEGRDENLEMAEEGRRFGIPVPELKPDEIASVDPNLSIRKGGAFHYTTDTHLSPQKFVEGMASFLQNNGVAILTGTDVRGIETSDGSVTGLKTSRGTMRAKEYVLAGGAWSASLARELGLRLPIQPAKGYSITFPRTPDMFSTPMILTERKVAITPMGDAVRYGGTLELAGFDLSINMRRVRAIADAVHLYLNDVRVPEFSEPDVWSGLRPCTPDGLPYLGRTLRYPNFVAATGHAMLGISLAPVTGKLVSEIVAGDGPSVDCTLMRPERFS